MTAKPPPTSALTAYIKALPRSTAGRIALAKALSLDATPIVKAFDDTATAYSDYDNLRPFTPGRIRRYPPGCARTESVAAALELRGRKPWEVADAPQLNFVYLDREIVPQAGHVKLSVTKIDVVLASVPLGGAGVKGNAVIGEIKTASDTDSFYALLQALNGAAQLSGQLQRARLSLWCSRSDFVVATARPDIYVLLVDRPADAALLVAKKVGKKLGSSPAVKKRIRRIEFLHLCCDGHGNISSIKRA